MRWKLYNNPYYFACVASAEKHRTALSRYEEPAFCESTPMADDSPSHITKDEPHIVISDGFHLSTGLCKDMRTYSTRSAKTFPIGTSHNKHADQGGIMRDSGHNMMDAMQRELEKVWVQVQELEEACIWARMEINSLQLRVDHGGCAKGRSWPSKVYAKLAAKVLSIKEDAAQELAHNPQHQQRLHIKNLEKQLADSKTALVKAKEEMLKERKGREILDLICSELARKIGQDQVDIDELKQGLHAGRKMEDCAQTQGEYKILEAWREEMVQVKLSEAKFEVAHSNLSLDPSFEQKLKSFLSAASTRKRRRKRS